MVARKFLRLSVVVTMLSLFLFGTSATTLGDDTENQNRVGVIAHRGYWKGNVQNSCESLRKALQWGLYGSETDVWLTKDNHLMVNHDSSYNGVVIRKSDFETCKKLILANGERMPELTDFLEMIATDEGPTKLIIEIKDHRSATLNRAAALATIKAVKQYGVENRVEYISFNADVCEQIIKEDSNAKVAYLSGDVAPEILHAKGYTGIDYQLNVIRKRPEWVDEAHRLGMSVNVWTVNHLADFNEMVQLGVDFITTDNPDEALEVVKSNR